MAPSDEVRDATETVANGLDLSSDDAIGLAGSVAFCSAVGIIPGLLTVEDVETWYERLETSDRTPPNWAFGPVWTMLYILMGVSRYLVLREATHDKRAARALSLFATQLGLNALWTLTFFRGHFLFGSLLVIIPLWVAIVATIVAFARVNRKAAILLVPYLLWVSFAALLNYDIWKLNR
jgi:benzodiazapine receptor